MPYRTGVPRSWTSDLEKFEAPDPAEWCPRGYAIVNVDPRGVGDSEGDIFTIGTQVNLRDIFPTQVFLIGLQEGRDGHDTVEYIASQSWCNGSIAFVGNSWLGVSQWCVLIHYFPSYKIIFLYSNFEFRHS